MLKRYSERTSIPSGQVAGPGLRRCATPLGQSIEKHQIVVLLFEFGAEISDKIETIGPEFQEKKMRSYLGIRQFVQFALKVRS